MKRVNVDGMMLGTTENLERCRLLPLLPRHVTEGITVSDGPASQKELQNKSN